MARTHFNKNNAFNKMGDVMLLLIGLLFLFPLVWIVISSVTKNATLAITPLQDFTFEPFLNVFSSAKNVTSFVNSIYLSMGTTLITVIIASAAAYPLSRYNLPFKTTFIYLMIFATGLPMVALMVPVYEVFASYNIINSIWWTIFFLTATSLPFATWMMKGFIDAVPTELEESALVEGCNSVQGFIRIVIPLVIPGTSVVAIYTFVHVWGNFIVPFILLQGDRLPAAVRIYQYFSDYSVDYSGLAAFSIVYTLPAILLYIIMTKWVGGGFTLGGAVKG